MTKAWIKRGPAAYETSFWSGGSTTELAIAPEGARYADRNFLWRVSSATVEREESDFTPLPDYDRLIATLQGGITLRHNGGAPLPLEPFQVHAFSGADSTHSSGRCTDFNLMLRRGAEEGEMEAMQLASRQTVTPHLRAETLLLYCVAGSCTVAGAGGRERLTAGESLLLPPDGPLTLEPETGEARLMLCQIWQSKGINAQQNTEGG